MSANLLLFLTGKTKMSVKSFLRYERPSVAVHSAFVYDATFEYTSCILKSLKVFIRSET